jgi:7-cyano-7-deazaguanine synthase
MNLQAQSMGEFKDSNTHEKGNVKPTVLVLLSGGIDSSACVAFYLEETFAVRAVFVDYGQLAARREIAAAKAIAAHYRIPLTMLQWSGHSEKSTGFILGRNAFLLIAALMELPDACGLLALGVHSGTPYVDCSPTFIRKMQSIFDMYTEGRVQIGTPFLRWTKPDVWGFCKSRGVPVELTYSCEHGLDQPCGTCLSCDDLEALRACT